MKKVFLLIALLAVLAIGGIVMAQGVNVPDKAIDNSPALERVIFIHYKKDFTKPDNPGKTSGGTSCFGFLSKGAKLKAVEDLVIHPDLNLPAVLNSVQEWDANTSTTLFGNYTVDATANWDSATPDGRNEFSFGNYSQSGVIAVTVAWGNFSGPISSRSISEFDIMFNTDYSWGDAETNPALMDIQNIATHEIGHGVGLADIYQTACFQVTMYGYSDYGETDKRTLQAPDIKGLQALYGN